MRQRFVSTVYALVTVGLIATACSQPPAFQGTELQAADQAPPFRLQDQFGSPVALDDFAGKVVVLTFLYTNCPDVCPLIAETLNKAHQELGDDARRVQLVAISVDPARDTVEQVRRYSEEKGLLETWAFLVGSEEQLAPIWSAYYIAAQREDVGRNQGVSGRLAKAASTSQGTGSIQDTQEAVSYLVGHSSAVYLIDEEGRMRVLFTDLSLDPGPLVHDIRLLL